MNKKALEILYKKLDPWSMETPEKTKDQIFAEILKEIQHKKAFVLESNNVVFYLMPETKYRARLHLFSDVKSLKEGISGSNELTNFLFCNINNLQKIYGITPHKKFLPIIHKFGWRHEGILTNSYLSKDGKIIDQFIFGITRNEYEKHLINEH